MAMYDSEGNYYASYNTDPETTARYMAIWNGGGTVDQKLAQIAAEGAGYSGAVEWATNNGFDVSNSGVGRVVQQMKEDAQDKGTGALREGIKATTLGGAAVLGGVAAAPYVTGAGATGAATTGAGTGATTGAGTFTGGFSGAVAGSPGLSGAAIGAPGLAAAPAAGTALAPAFFAAETLAPVGLGGAGLYGAGTAGAADVAGGGALSSGAAGGSSAIIPTAGGAAAAAGGLGSFLSNPAVLGAAGGALLGSGLLGGGTQAGTIQVEEGIPDWLMPYVKPQLDRYATDVQNYQIDPYGIMPSAMQGFKDTISGMYLDPSTNKHLEDYYRMGAERVKGALSPSFGHMQAFGSHTGYNESLSKGLSELATGLYGGAYEKERDRQNQMIGAAPQFLGQSSTQAFAPYQQYLSTVGSLGKKKQEPFYESPFGNLMGGAFMGAGLGKLFSE